MPTLIALLLVAAGPAGKFLDLREGTLRYTVVHKLHEVRGASRRIEGRALAQPDGTVRVQVRAKVASFDSGNASRDEHLREATHEARHPYASVKGTLTHLVLPLAAPAASTLHAIVELNGGKQAVDVPVKLKPEGGGVRATFSFPISLGAFKVERPQLLFVKVDDRVVIEGDLLFRAAK
jgi:polyisoprenoid-binding protein YceI